jgi:hypothetical protein
MDEAVDAIVAVLNAWADADLERLRAVRDELASQVLPRMPKVLPERGGSRQRATRHRPQWRDGIKSG